MRLNKQRKESTRSNLYVLVVNRTHYHQCQLLRIYVLLLIQQHLNRSKNWSIICWRLSCISSGVVKGNDGLRLDDDGAGDVLGAIAVAAFLDV